MKIPFSPPYIDNDVINEMITHFRKNDSKRIINHFIAEFNYSIKVILHQIR